MSKTCINCLTEYDDQFNICPQCGFIENAPQPDGKCLQVGTNLTTITIPSSVTEINGKAFYCCSGLTSVTIPSSVTEIGMNAFLNCSSLSSVTIPSSVKKIDRWVFYGCNLSSVTIAKDCEVVDSFDSRVIISYYP